MVVQYTYYIITFKREDCIYYNFNKDVFIVKGAKRHCIYNLKDSKLFNMNKKSLNLIEYITCNSIDLLDIDTKGKEFLSKLIKQNIIVKYDSIHTYESIETIKKDRDIEFVCM